jgi:hypothetical protein
LFARAMNEWAAQDCGDGCTDALMTAHGFGPVELSTALADDQPSR